MVRRINLALMLLFGSLWAGLLVVGGAMLSTQGAATWPGMQNVVVAAGLSGVAGGFFVFSVIVADRIFPHAHRGLVIGLETLSGLALLFGLLAIVVIFILAKR